MLHDLKSQTSPSRPCKLSSPKQNALIAVLSEQMCQKTLLRTINVNNNRIPQSPQSMNSCWTVNKTNAAIFNSKKERGPGNDCSRLWRVGRGREGEGKGGEDCSQTPQQFISICKKCTRNLFEKRSVQTRLRTNLMFSNKTIYRISQAHEEVHG